MQLYVYGTEIEVDAAFPIISKSRGFPPALKVYESKNSVDITENQNSFEFFRNNQERDIYFLEPQRAQKRFAVLIDEVALFSWDDQKQGNIEYERLQDGTDARVAYWLMQLVLPVYFTFFEIYFFLHGSAVEVEGEHALFFADSFGGKSTMADYFVNRGHPLVTDDKLPVRIDEGVHFLASYPYHRPYRGVEDMGRHVKRLSALQPTRAFGYRLLKASPEDEITISSVSGAEKFQIVRGASELNFTQDILAHTRYLAKVSNALKMFEISVPWDINRLPEVYERITHHIKEYR